MTEKKGMSRREFLSKSAKGAAGMALAGTLLSSDRAWAANDRIRVACIGTGGRMGGIMADLKNACEDLNVEITAICDTWRIAREANAKKVEEWYGKKPFSTSDYEEIMARDDIDAVAIATPDFAHAPILAAALRAGKDVFVEKPMATELADAVDAMNAYKDSGRIVQVGTQRRSIGEYKAAAEIMKSGILGTVSRAEISWNDANPRWLRDTSNVHEEDVDWKRYLMGKEYRPFNADQYRRWHLYRDFTIGTIGLLGTHYIDIVNWLMDDPFPSVAVGLGAKYVWPEHREHEDTVYTLIEYPKGFICRYLTGLGNKMGHGCQIYGTRGMFDTNTMKFTAAGGRDNGSIEEEVVATGKPSENHVRNWVECMRSRKQPNAPIEAGFQHSVTSILGYQAMLTGKKLRYLPDQRKIVEA